MSTSKRKGKWMEPDENYENKLVMNRHKACIDNSDRNKKLLGQKYVRHHVKAPDNADVQLRAIIEISTDANEIANAITRQIETIEHDAIFGKAMQKCKALRDWKSVRMIMDSLLNSKFKPDTIHFNIFFNCMALSDGPKLCIEYFRMMVNKYKLEPDVITFGSIMKSFRRQANVSEAEKCWNMMAKYRVNPNDYLYTEMISVYAKSGQKDKGSKLFHEYLNKVQQTTLPRNIYTFGAYLNLFSRDGDIDGMDKATALFQAYDFEMNSTILGDLMRGYYTAGYFKESIETLTNWLNDENQPTLPLMHLKCCALVRLIAETDSFAEKCDNYKKLQHTLYKELEQFKLKMDDLIVMTQLCGAINCYCHNDPWKIVEICDELCDKGLVGYTKYEASLKKYVIDLHLCQLSEAQFLMRYIVATQLKRMLTFSNDGLWVVVGKGKHTPGERKNKFRLRQFIIDELLSWDPPIKCSIHKTKGMLFIDKEYLLPYTQNDMNYAREKLTIGSDDWYVHND